MEKLIRHGREREVRGKLKSFGDLPIKVQDTFKLIKGEVITYFKEPVDVYVFGSYHWGFWDEQSDFDVRIERPDYNSIEFIEMFREKYGLKVNVMTLNYDNGILIP